MFIVEKYSLLRNKNDCKTCFALTETDVLIFASIFVLRLIGIEIVVIWIFNSFVKTYTGRYTCIFLFVILPKEWKSIVDIRSNKIYTYGYKEYVIFVSASKRTVSLIESLFRIKQNTIFNSLSSPSVRVRVLHANIANLWWKGFQIDWNQCLKNWKIFLIKFQFKILDKILI